MCIRDRFGRIQCVTYPGYIAEVVFLSFLNLHEDVYRAVIVGLDTVCHDDGVTITQFVVFVDNQLFVRFVVVLNEFLGAEQIDVYKRQTRKDTCPTVSISMYWMSRLKRWPTPLCRRTNRLQYSVVVVSVVKRPLPY